MNRKYNTERIGERRSEKVVGTRLLVLIQLARPLATSALRPVGRTKEAGSASPGLGAANDSRET